MAPEDLGVVEHYVPAGEFGRDQGDPHPLLSAQQLGASHTGEATAYDKDVGSRGLVHYYILAPAAGGCRLIGEYNTTALVSTSNVDRQRYSTLRRIVAGQFPVVPET